VGTVSSCKNLSSAVVNFVAGGRCVSGFKKEGVVRSASEFCDD
jgi:hypothetical protein